MLYAHSQFGLAPPNTIESREPEAGIGRGEPLHLGQKLFPSIVSKRDERCASVIEVFAVRVREQSPHRSGLAVTIRADNHKAGLGEALCLEPSLGSPA
jgi:hypothetical protein